MRTNNHFWQTLQLARWFTSAGPFRSGAFFIASLLLGVGSPCIAQGQTHYTFTKIVETGTAGSNGQTIVLCGPNIPTTINNSGTVAFFIQNSGGVGMCTSGGGYGSIWTGNGSAPLLIFPLDNSGLNGPSGPGPGAVIASGEVAFVNPGALTNQLYLGNGGQPTLLANGPFPSSFIAANSNGAVSVISEGPGGVPGAVLRYDAPLASPVAIDSDTQDLYGYMAIDTGLEVAFTKEDPNTFQRTRVLKGSGAQVTTIGQAGNTLNGLTLELVGPYVAIRDDGFVAFQGFNQQQGTGIYLGNGSQTFVVVDTQGASPFQGVDNPALNNAGQVAFWGLLKAASCSGVANSCYGIYTGPDPVADKVIQTGDLIDGLTVVQVDNAYPPSINDKGQIAIGLWLQSADGTQYAYAVYRADPAAPTSTALQASPTSAVFGQTVSLTATVSSGSGVPNGSAQFFDGASSLSTVALNGAGVAQLLTSSLGVGTHSIKATYPGDINFQKSASSTVVVTVNKASTSVAITATPNPAKKRQPIQIKVTVSAQAPGAGIPSGSVQLMNGKKQLGASQLANGSATFSMTFNSPGDVTLTASYGGDAHFNGQASSNYVVQVSK